MSDDPKLEALLDEVYRIDFSAGKSIRYHAYRRSFWLAWDHWSKVFSVVTGTGVVVSAFQKDSSWTTLFALITATTAAGDVVFGFSDRANKHDGLYKDWSRLQQKIALCSEENVTGKTVAKFKARRLEIEREEPSHLDLLERRCAAEECVARGLPISSPLWQLSKWQTAFAQWNLFPLSSKR